MERIKLPFRIRAGYGLGQVAAGAPFNLFFIYFVFFLTAVAGVSPAIAGTISLIVLIVDALVVPFAGALSDNYVTEKGRRLPWMKATILPMAILLALLFAPFELGTVAIQMVYYILLGVALWVIYAGYQVPYFALVTEITADYAERNNLRGINISVGYFITMLATSGPMWIWVWAGTNGFSDRDAWGITGVVFAGLIVVGGILCLVMLRGCEAESIKVALAEKKEKVKENFFKIWGGCFKIRSFRKVAIWLFLYATGLSIGTTVFVHTMTFNAGMTLAQQGVYWIPYCLFIMATIPFYTFLANKIGKKATLIIVLGAGAAIATALFFTGMTSIVHMYIYGLLVGSAIGCFYTFYIGLAYDCVEINEYQTGNRDEGSMIGLTLFMMKLGTALGMFIAGVLLQITGFDGEVFEQTPEALRGIILTCLIVPSIFTAVSLVVLSTYKVNIKNFNALVDALEKKRAGEEYSDEEFKEIL